MKASVEIDLLLHFGYFKNVNLLSRGIYRLKVSLVCGSQKIIPVGMFAAPSTFHSFVDQQEIESVGMITPAEVDEEQHCFVGRAMVIRYKGEKHELNEGVHWRFTLHDLDLVSQVQGPKLNQLLGVKFELQFCDFLDEKDVAPGLSDDFRRFVPIDPKFETVSVQRLMIQSLTSGLHLLYSVSFDGDHFSALDAMFHACITSIHCNEFQHNSILPNSIAFSNAAGANNNLFPVSSPTPTPTKISRRMSTTIEKDRADSSSTSSSRGGIFKFLASPEKLLFGYNDQSKGEESRSNVITETIQKGGALLGLMKMNDMSSSSGTFSNQSELSSYGGGKIIHLSQKIDENQAFQLFKFFSAPVVLNYQRSVQQSQFIINDFLVGNSTVASSSSGKHIFDIETYNKHSESLNNKDSKCILLESDNEIMNSAKVSNTFLELVNEINRNVEICNTILSLRWTLIVNSLKHIMKPVKKYLMRGFLEETSAFWKQQQMIYTRNIGGAHHLTSNKDEDVLETLMAHIKFERENDIVACTVREQLRDDDGLYSSTAKSTIPVFARGMNIFDTEAHMIPSRLPYLFVEQYIPDPTAVISNDKVPNSNVKTSTFRGLHVIFLQHGFLGTSYDMRQLAQALNLLCPENTLIYSLKHNELCGQDSITEMAEKLASEMYDYCAERAPDLLDQSLHHNQCRVSFIGHSLGSVMIRLALQNPNLSSLRNKLHLFVSLASPHIGNLFSDSQLVSTGMWALSKFKNCQSLKELVMEDEGNFGSTSQQSDNKTSQSQKKEKDKESSLLYNLSKFKTFSLFKKVVLVSCPKDQYVPFYSARIQTTPRIIADASSNGFSSNGGIVSSMVHNLLDCLEPHQLLRVTVMNYNPTIHVPPRFDDKAAKIEKERKHEISSTNQVASLLLKENHATVFDLNAMIGRSAHICYLESPIVAYQLMLSLQRYFINDQMPK